MTLTQKAVLSFFVAAALALMAYVAGVSTYKAQANASAFIDSGCSTAPATTSVSYLSAGAGTTTVPACAFGLSSPGVSDSAKLFIQFTGSSTPLSLINVAYEYSQDGVDWYADAIDRGATTTQTISLNQPTTRQLNMASTSLAGAAGNSARTTRIVDVPTPTRWVRAIITMPAGSQPGAVWASFIGKREI